MAQHNQGKAQIHMVVSADQKQRWMDHVEQNGEAFSSLAQLVRVAVEKEINNEDSPESRDLDQEIAAQITQLDQGMGEIEDTLQTLDSRLSSIEQNVRDNPTARRLANRVFEILPTKKALDSYEETIREAGGKPPSLSIHKSGRIEDIAESLDRDESEIKQAIDKLQWDTHQVHRTERYDEIRFYKED